MAFTVFTNRVDGLHLSTSAPVLWTGEVGRSCPAEVSWRETTFTAFYKHNEVPHPLSSAVPPPMAPLSCLKLASGSLVDASHTDVAKVKLLEELEELLSIEPLFHADHSGHFFVNKFADFFSAYGKPSFPLCRHVCCASPLPRRRHRC